MFFGPDHRPLTASSRCLPGQDLQASAGSGLIAAVRAGDVRAVRELLCVAANPAALLDWRDEDGWTALHHGAAEGSLSCVRILCEQGANPNAKDNVRAVPSFLDAPYDHKGPLTLDRSRSVSVSSPAPWPRRRALRRFIGRRAGAGWR